MPELRLGEGVGSGLIRGSLHVIPVEGEKEDGENSDESYRRYNQYSTMMSSGFEQSPEIRSGQDWDERWEKGNKINADHT